MNEWSSKVKPISSVYYLFMYRYIVPSQNHYVFILFYSPDLLPPYLKESFPPVPSEYDWTYLLLPSAPVYSLVVRSVHLVVYVLELPPDRPPKILDVPPVTLTLSFIPSLTISYFSFSIVVRVEYLVPSYKPNMRLRHL